MNPSGMKTILAGKGNDPFDVMEALQDIQEALGFLPEEAMCSVSDALEVPLIEVFRLANFYKAFSLKPRGRHLITVCLGTACHVQGAPRLVDAVMNQLKVGPGETTCDGAFTLETVNCIGACALAPVLIMNGEYYNHMTSDSLARLIQATREFDRKKVANA